MKTFLIKIYCDDLDNKVKEFVFRCTDEEIDAFTKKEVEMFEKTNNRKATDVMIFEKVKDYK
jgi:hypothetical protein